MRNRGSLLLFVLVVLAPAVVAWAGQSQKPAAVVKVAWEYRVASDTLNAQLPDLDRIGSEGWELVGVQHQPEAVGNYHTVRRYYYFKRAK